MNKAKFHKNNHIDKIDVETLKKSKFQRMCLHKSEKSQLHCMLIHKDLTDIAKVHRHPTKDEVFIVLEGIMDIITYDEDLNQKDTKTIESYEKNGIFAYMIPANVWHKTITVTDLVYMEFIIGPFDKEINIEWL